MTRDSESGRRRPHPLVAAAVCVVLLLAAACLLRHFVVQPFTVPSASMQPALQPGDVVLADRGDRGTAQRGDIVVLDGSGFFAPSDESNGRYWVKRVVATGGERVACCDKQGRLTIDGTALSEPYLPDAVAPSTVSFDLQVPEGRMFVLGDNRADSTDSRSLLGAPGGGMIPLERVVGHVDRVVWPLARAGSL